MMCFHHFDYHPFQRDFYDRLDLLLILEFLQQLVTPIDVGVFPWPLLVPPVIWNDMMEKIILKSVSGHHNLPEITKG